MFHSRIQPAQPIHPTWCTCRDCRSTAERAVFRLDLLAIILGALSAFGIVFWLLLAASQ